MAGPALRDVQAAFWRSLAGAPDPALLGVVRDGGPLGAAERVGIYAGMYLWRLVDALAEDFPKLAATLGADAFADVVRAYLALHPSTAPSIRHVGRALPGFVAGREPAWLADLARLEWTRLDVFDAPDAEPLRLDELRAIPAERWPDLRFAAVPGFARLVTGWPVHELWTDAPPPLAPRPTALRVWRDGFLVYQAAMEPTEDAALAALVAGEPFGAVCEAVADPPAAAALLLRWIEDGIVRADPESGPRA
jgi:hypothetical protein